MDILSRLQVGAPAWGELATVARARRGAFSFPAAALCPKLTATMQKETTLALLQQMLGPEAQFRDGQW